jgi:ABC-type histidine transport system ATPase subunit
MPAQPRTTMSPAAPTMTAMISIVAHTQLTLPHFLYVVDLQVHALTLLLNVSCLVLYLNRRKFEMNGSRELLWQNPNSRCCQFLAVKYW